MNEYLIQHRICSISHLAMGDGTDPTIEIDGIVCRQEHFTLQTGPTGDFWFAEGRVHAPNPQDAYSIFVDKLERVVSIFSLVGQGYIRLMLEPYLITRTDAFPDIGLFRFTRDRDTHGLLLLERHGDAVKALGSGCLTFVNLTKAYEGQNLRKSPRLVVPFGLESIRPPSLARRCRIPTGDPTGSRTPICTLKECRPNC